MKILDQQIESTTDAATREGLRQLKDAIREESEDRLKELEARFEKKFDEAKMVSQASIKAGILKDLKVLEEIYGEELVEKYKDQVEANSLRWPGAHSPDKWLNSVAEPDELRQALRIRLRKEAVKPSEDKAPEKKPASLPTASTKPAIDTDKYKGKNPQQIRVGFGKALDDSLSEGFRKMGISRR